MACSQRKPPTCGIALAALVAALVRPGSDFVSTEVACTPSTSCTACAASLSVAEGATPSGEKTSRLFRMTASVYGSAATTTNSRRTPEAASEVAVGDEPESEREGCASRSEREGCASRSMPAEGLASPARARPRRIARD